MITFVFALVAVAPMANAWNTTSLRGAARRLDEASGRDFRPIPANNGIQNKNCEDWGSWRQGNSNAHRIPPGKCVNMNARGTLKLDRGLHIQGRLTFPARPQRLEIRTPHIFVEGMLDLRLSNSLKVPSNNNRVTFVITKSSGDIKFRPHQHNRNACGGAGGSCNVGTKAVVVAGGRLDISAMASNCPSWLKLRRAIYSNGSSGGRVVALEVSRGSNFCWARGARIMITSPTISHIELQTARIAGVQTLGNVVRLTLDRPINAVIDEAFDSRQAVEVVLLDRTVVFRGQNDEDNRRKIGPHLMVMNTPNVDQHIRGIQLDGMGQLGHLGRYPMHMHMSGNLRGTVLEKLLVTFSHQRGVVLHGVQNVRVHDNVVYWTYGHAFMLEDGSETGNTFTRNLGAGVNSVGRPRLISPDEADDTAAVYWISHGNNDFRGNVAASSLTMGFWYDMRERVRGLSASRSQYRNIRPKWDPMGEFRDNIAHSCLNGLQTYPGTGYNPSRQARFDRNSLYRNRLWGAFFKNSRNMDLANAYLSDNGVSVDIENSYNIRILSSDITGISDKYSTFLHRYDYDQNYMRHCWKPATTISGIMLHEQARMLSAGGTRIENVRFFRLGEANTGCRMASAISVAPTRNGHFDTRNRVKRISLDRGTTPTNLCTNGNARALATRTAVLHDEDGSLLGSFTGQLRRAAVVANFYDMTFAGGCSSNARAVGSCARVCTNICYRTMNIIIGTQQEDYGRSARMRVKAPNGRTLTITGSQSSESDRGRYLSENSRRTFEVILPTGRRFSFEFFLQANSQSRYWPQYVITTYTDTPSQPCPALAPFSFNAPNPSCSNLVKNGDFRDSELTNWGYSGRDKLTLTVQRNSGSTHLLVTGRRRTDVGPVTWLDARCIQRGETYELTARVRMSRQGSCRAHTRTRCVNAGVQARYGPNDVKQLFAQQTQFSNGWNNFRGRFQATESIAEAQMVSINFEGPQNNVDIRLGNVRVRRV